MWMKKNNRTGGWLQRFLAVSLAFVIVFTGIDYSALTVYADEVSGNTVSENELESDSDGSQNSDSDSDSDGTSTEDKESDSDSEETEKEDETTDADNNSESGSVSGNSSSGNAVLRSSSVSTVNDTTSTDIVVTTYSQQNLYIYHAQQYTSADGTPVSTAGGIIVLKMDESNSAAAVSVNVEIGDVSGQAQMANTDIQVALQGLVMPENKTVTVHQVNSGSNKVIMSVTEDAKVPVLKVDAGAKLELILNADMELDSLILGEGSSLTITVNEGATLNLGKLEGSAADVIINGSGTVDAEAITADDLIVEGTTLNVSGDISANGELTLNNAKVTMTQSGMITAGGNISSTGSDVTGAALFGYTKEAEGNKTITLSGGNFSNVGIVGAYVGVENENEVGSKAVVAISGNVTTTIGTSYVSDYTMSYLVKGSEPEMGETWPVSYRVKAANPNGTGTVVGYHQQNGEYISAKQIPLPECEEAGYTYMGWTLGEADDETAVKVWPEAEGDAVSGNKTLTAQLVPGTVTVTWELGDYEINQYTNDDPEAVKEEYAETLTAKIDEEISLKEPYRFGYSFEGWRIGDSTTVLTGEKYTVSLDDVSMAGEGADSYTLQMNAVWEPLTYSLRLNLSSTVASSDTEFLLIVDGVEQWIPLAELQEKLKENQITAINYDYTMSQFGFAEGIQYNESLGEYFNRILGYYPQLRDQRSDVSEQMRFIGWSTTEGKTLPADARYTIDGGFAPAIPADTKVSAYETAFSETITYLLSSWDTMEYSLTVDQVTGWSFYVNGTQKTPDENGEIIVETGDKVVFRVDHTDYMGISLWAIGEIDPMKEGYQPIAVEELEYIPANGYVEYQFIMPASDVAAAYGRTSRQTEDGTVLLGQYGYTGEDGNLWINLYDSPITFAEEVQHNGRTRNGFWLNTPTSLMTYWFSEGEGEDARYFYPWISTDRFYVTSGGLPTTNQLTMVNAMEVQFRDCEMVATDAYSSDLVDRKIKELLLEGKTAEGVEGLAAIKDKNIGILYGNVVIDNTSHTQYKTVLYFEGENTMAGLFPQRFYGDTTYLGDLEIRGVADSDGTKGTVNLGCVFGNYEVRVYDLTIKEYRTTKYQTEAAAGAQSHPDNSEYLFYISDKNESKGNLYFHGCDISAPNKRIYTMRGTIYYYKYSTTGKSTHAVIRGSRHYSNSIVNGDGFLHVMGDVIGNHNTFDISGNASVIVDGSVVVTWLHYTGSASINTTGYVVVKGDRYQAWNLNLSKGTIIANTLVLGNACSIAGGTVIANQITNEPLGEVKTDSDGQYYASMSANHIEPANQNGDDSVYLTYSGKRTDKGVYNFKGGNVWLLGYYQLTAEGAYDENTKATSAGNPVGDVIAQVIEGSGTESKIKSSVDLSGVLASKMQEAYTQNADSECLILGNSTYVVGQNKERTFSLSGTNIHAAGNLTFFNDTVISGGTIECVGTLSGKRDLTVNSNAVVKAKEIGNAYDLVTETADKNIRWQKTMLLGGSITTGRVGALSAKINGVEPRSTVELGVTIQPLETNGSVTCVQDIYINYIYDSDVYTVPAVPDENPRTVRFTGSVNGVSALENAALNLVNDGLTALTEQKIADPVETVSSVEAEWIAGSLDGEVITRIAADGDLYNENTVLAGKKTYDREQLPLYAAKGNYQLKIMAGGNYIADASGIQISYDDGGDTGTASVPKKQIVTLKLTEEAVKAKMYEKTVVWYYDGNGVVHNLMPTVTEDSISFTMPLADVEVWITDEFTIYLDQYNIQFTPCGFSTSLDDTVFSVAADTVYLYKGNLRVTQSNIDGTYIKDSQLSQGNGTLYTVHPKGVTLTSGTYETYATRNTMTFTAGSGNGSADGTGLSRKITLEGILQAGDAVAFGTFIAKNEQVVLHIDGELQLIAVQNPEGSSVKFVGDNYDENKVVSQEDRPADALYFCRQESLSALDTLVGTSSGKAGTVAFEGLNLPVYAGTLVRSAANSTSEVSFKDCYLYRRSWRHDAALASEMGDISIEGCYFEIVVSDTNSGKFVASCLDMNIKDSHIGYTYGASYTANPFLTGIDILSAENSDIVLGFNQSASKELFEKINNSSIAKKVVLNNSSLTANGRLNLLSLELQNASSVVVNEADSSGEDAGNVNSYLLCPDILVDGNSSIEAGNIILSGYYYPLTESAEVASVSDIKAKLAARSGLLDGNAALSRLGKVPSGLVLNSGTVTAGEFVGGDINGKITVNGGTLEARYIGTRGAVFGAPRYLSNGKQPYVYRDEYVPLDTEDGAPTGAVVTVNGGTVKVAENGYLGGIKSSVTVNGGTVELADNAIIGMTEADQEKLELDSTINKQKLADGCDLTVTNAKITAEGSGKTGSIRTPYSDVVVNGKDTTIQVKDFDAPHGSITITEANAGIVNAYTGQDRIHNAVGVSVSGQLKALDLAVQNGAVVYAGEAFTEAESGEAGTFTVTDGVEGGSNAYLYVQNGYGTYGTGTFTIEIENENKGGGESGLDYSVYSHVFGSNRRSIIYHLMDDELDPATNSENNPTGFVFDPNGDSLPLKEAERHGYVFAGWYANEDYSGTRIDAVPVTAATDHNLYAKWEPKTVKFSLQVEQQVGNTTLDLTAETKNIAGELVDGVFYYEKTVDVAYLTAIIGDGEGQLKLKDFALNTYALVELSIADSQYNEKEEIIVAGRTAVSSELLAAYEQKVKEAEEDGDESTDPDKVTIVLKVKQVGRNRAQLILDLNVDSATGRPVDSAFEASDKADTQTATTKASYADIGSAILGLYGAKGFSNANGELVGAEAPGYTFEGWFREVNGFTGTGDPLTKDFVVTDEATVRFYAGWTPNHYKVAFDGGDGYVTQGTAAPEGGYVTQTLYGKVEYDTQIQNGIEYDDGTEGGVLPTAWKKGYVFLGWSWDGTAENLLSETDELNLSTLPKMDVTKIYESDDTMETAPTAVTLKAVYEKVTVSYDLNGGKWTDQNNIPTETPDYGAALAGYTINSETGAIELISTSAANFAATGSYDAGDYRETLYRMGYTFQGWYDKNDTDAEINTTPDYAHVELTAKWTANSYTLQLYAKDQAKYNEGFYNNDFGHDPDIEDASQQVQVVVDEQIKTDTAVGVNVDNWPVRAEGDNNDWWVKNKNEDVSATNAKRYILGYTFDSLNPGDTNYKEADSAYTKYGEAVNTLTNQDTLFVKAEGTQEGSRFFLPDEDVYSNAIVEGTNAVKDYPNGSTIPMYAVYREVSLVFIQYVKWNDGTVEEKVMHTVPWNNYDTYPDTYLTTQDYKTLTQPPYQYSLVGWYINSTTTSGTKYDSNSYGTEENRQTLKKQMAAQGIYDINVYTVYVAQASPETPVVLEAGSDPTVNKGTVYRYSVPGSMQTGQMKYTLSDADGWLDELQLESSETLNDSLYDSDRADDTVAIKVELFDSETATTPVETTFLKKGTYTFEKAVSAGWVIQMTLYHSSVMTQEQTFPFELEFGFVDQGLEEQKISFTDGDISVKLVPSIWQVTYDANIPAYYNADTMDWGDFSSDIKQLTVNMAYGSRLISEAETDAGDGDEDYMLPVVEGYTASGEWVVLDTDGNRTTHEMQYGTALNAPVSAANKGKINVITDWTPNEYVFRVTDDILEKWTVSYQTAEGETNTFSSLNKEMEIPYHANITFVPKETQEGAYVWLSEILTDDSGTESLAEGTRLDRFGAEHDETTNTYTFQMPAKDLEAGYSETITLYLKEGDIEIQPTEYTHKGETVYWPGNYLIRMDRNDDTSVATENTLTVQGDLVTKVIGNMESRTIELAALNISADDSIELIPAESGETATNVAMVATGESITAKNILVPENTTLSMTGAALSEGVPTSKLVLDPAVNTAAIGAKADGTETAAVKCGTISLSQLDIEMGLAPQSTASGIGSGNQVASDSGSATITLNNCAVTVEEEVEVNNYKGVWIGGASVADVNIQNSTINKKSGSAAVGGTMITDGNHVTLNNVTVGSVSERVTTKLGAGDRLEIINSRIYQSIDSDVAIDTSGSIVVKDGSIIDSPISNLKTYELYKGTMYIDDAASDVVIGNVQILETENGDIEISADGVIQGGETHAHTGSYRIINAYDTVDPAALTINGLGNSAKVQVDDVTLTNVTVNANTDAELLGDLTVTGKLQIADGQTLSVEDILETDENDQTIAHTVTLNGTIVDTEGTYVQNNGSLIGAVQTVDINGKALGKGFYCVNLDVKLENVNTILNNMVAENLTLTGGSVTAENGLVGALGVLAKGNEDAAYNDDIADIVVINGTVITAGVIGAVGDYDESFTYVGSAYTLEGTGTDSDPAVVKITQFTDAELEKLNGTLQQDWYRLEYDIHDPNFSTDDLGRVLRTVRTEVNGSYVETVIPGEAQNAESGIPDDPAYTGTGESYFTNWYVILNAEGSDEFWALSTTTVDGFGEKFMRLAGDTVDKSADAEITGDGTRTLIIHALEMQGTGAIVAERQLNALTSDPTAETVTVPADGAWTAVFTAKGARIEGSQYQVAFGTQLPQNTQLTLIDRSGSHPVYYHYQVTGAEGTVIPFSSFVRMGKEAVDANKAQLPAGDSGEQVSNTLYLAADFSQANASVYGASDPATTVDFQLKIGNADPMSLAQVSYKLSAAPAASLSATVSASPAAGNANGTVTVQWDGDSRLTDEKLYLVAELTGVEVDGDTGSAGDTVSVPYGAAARLTITGNESDSAVTVPGRWIGGNKAAFCLGDAKNAVSETTYNYLFEGLADGSCQVTWTLNYTDDTANLLEEDTATAAGVNVYGTELARTEAAAMTVANSAAPSLTVQTTAGSRVIAKGTTVNFTYAANKTHVTMTAEKQGALGMFAADTSADVSCIIGTPELSSTANAASVTFGANTEPGTYRICFSIDANSRNDDVYFTFIVE